MNFVKMALAALLVSASLVLPTKAQASQRDFQNVATIIAVAALVKIAVDLEPVNDPYWDYRGNDRCYYKEVNTREVSESCRQHRSYYHNGYVYECVTVTTYGRDYIRTCR